jgi:hypothetical protein
VRNHFKMNIRGPPLTDLRDHNLWQDFVYLPSYTSLSGWEKCNVLQSNDSSYS